MLTLHAPILETRHLVWHSEADCAAFAGRVATRAELHNANIALHGPLGAGKTSFVRHLLRALGVEGRIKSPTYAVLESYELGPLLISHFDFYRFSDPSEWLDAGFRDLYAAPGLKLSEWPEKASGLLPPPDLDIQIQPAFDSDTQSEIQTDTDPALETARHVTLHARSAVGLALLP